MGSFVERTFDCAAMMAGGVVCFEPTVISYWSSVKISN